MVDNISSLSLPTPLKDTPERIHNAATQFEGLLIGEMLKSARESSSGGWMGTGDDAGADSAMGLAEQYFAQAMATGGGLGLARMIGAGLEKQSSQVTKTPLPEQ
jgi:Rod binding domain-containing protein